MIRLKNLLLEYDLNAEGELDKAKEIVKGLQARGFGYVGAVALAGNISHESGCDPDTIQVGGGGAYGLMQWDPGPKRRQALEAFAKHVGKPKSSLSTQLDFMKCELLNGYVWNGKPVPGIDKALVYYKQLDGSYKGLAKYYVKLYNNNVTNDIETCTANFMDSIFNPKTRTSKQQRIDNALKIDEYIKSGKTADSVTSTDTKKSITYTMYPNPAKPNDTITIKVSADALPIETIKLNIYNTTGKEIDKHQWNAVQQGILKFNGPDISGVYILNLSTGNSAEDQTLKLIIE